MRDIWEVLLQTLTCSVPGIYILIIKRVFRDKLPPLWQFSVWSIFFIALIIPAGAGKGLSFFTETLKTFAVHEFTISSPVSFFPLINRLSFDTLPDILFIIYISGVILFALKYMVSYIRLQFIIKKSPCASEENSELIRETAEKYSLKYCPAVTVDGVSSPFICGIIKPKLILPKEKNDEKIILHELLHLKYHDAVYGIIVAVFRCIHWCNPFIRYCLNKINNDIEELCDSRVLNKLTGEDRRDYGNILLSMANDRYASVPGTTSAANGGKNIKSRIETIARFKLYPVGNAFVSVCIILILAASLLTNAEALTVPDMIKTHNETAVDISMSAARSYYCSTAEGAIDTYAKAILQENGIYRAISAPLSEHKNISNSLKKMLQTEGICRWDSTLEGNPENNRTYYVYNFTENAENEYTAYIVIVLQHFDLNEDDNQKVAYQKIKIYKEDKRWVTEPLSEFLYVTTYKMLGSWGCEDIPSHTVFSAQSGDFNIEYHYQTCFSSEDTYDKTSLPLLSTRFKQMFINNSLKAEYKGTAENKKNYTQIGISAKSHKFEDEYPELQPAAWGKYSSSSTDSTLYASNELNYEWDNELNFCGGGFTTESKDLTKRLPECIAADFYLNGELFDSLILTKE